jgi:predicted DNA-binding transcriptional regulator YafY
MFSPEELAEIRGLAAQAELAGREASARTLSGILAKLEALSGDPAGRLALFEEVLPLAEGGVEPATARSVRRALERQEPIRIRYRANRSGEVTTRRIRPFNIHFYNGQEYVEAFCELRGSDRIFALGNIEEVLGEDAPGSDSPPAADAADPSSESVELRRLAGGPARPHP